MPAAGPSQGRASRGGLQGLLVTSVLLGLLSELSTAQSHDSLEVLEEVNTGSSTETPDSSEFTRVSPQSSWKVFLNSNKGETRRSKPSKRLSKHGLPGPPGPPGPQGPPGPPAPLLPQQQELIKELQVKLREVAEGMCVLCERPPQVTISFHCRLLGDLSVPRRSLLEIQPYDMPPASDRSLQRGEGFNASLGRYTAPVSGFYHLSSRLLIEASDRVQARLRDSVRASICIESLCQSNVSVESVMGVGNGGGVFSILLTGTLYLQVGEYVSVFVDNATGSVISVLQDSLFSGVLLGI